MVGVARLKHIQEISAAMASTSIDDDLLTYTSGDHAGGGHADHTSECALSSIYFRRC